MWVQFKLKKKKKNTLNCNNALDQILICLWFVNVLGEGGRGPIYIYRWVCDIYVWMYEYTYKWFALTYSYILIYIYICIYICVLTYIRTYVYTIAYLNTRPYQYGVVMIGWLLKIIGLFCERALQKRLYSAQETYNFKEPTNRSHPIWWYRRKDFVTFTYVYIYVYMYMYMHTSYTCK